MGEDTQHNTWNRVNSFLHANSFPCIIMSNTASPNFSGTLSITNQFVSVVTPTIK